MCKRLFTPVRVLWHFGAPEGGGDTYMATTRGSRSTVSIRQGAAQRYQPELYVEPVEAADREPVEDALRQVIEALQRRYPGVGLQQDGSCWHIQIPETYRVGHEAHFGRVMETYLHALRHGHSPIGSFPIS